MVSIVLGKLSGSSRSWPRVIIQSIFLLTKGIVDSREWDIREPVLLDTFRTPFAGKFELANTRSGLRIELYPPASPRHSKNVSKGQK